MYRRRWIWCPILWCELRAIVYTKYWYAYPLSNCKTCHQTWKLLSCIHFLNVDVIYCFYFPESYISIIFLLVGHALDNLESFINITTDVSIGSTCWSTCALQISWSFQWEMVRLECPVKHWFVHNRHRVTSFCSSRTLYPLHSIECLLCFAVVGPIKFSIKLQNVSWFRVVRAKPEEKDMEETEADVK